jgi:acetyl-CoA carboxylase biotin carboxylase subunit
MISKLVVWGATRDEAITRLRRALEEYEVGGIRTTIPFFRHVLRDDDFINGNIDTEFISRFVTPTSPPTNESETPLTEKQLIAAIAAAISFTRESRQPTESSRPPVDQQSRWKIAGREALLRR